MSIDRPHLGDAPARRARRPDPYATQPHTAALRALVAALDGDGIELEVDTLHLTASVGGREVEVWVQRRASDGGRLWFTWAGGLAMVEAEHVDDAALAVRTALALVRM